MTELYKALTIDDNNLVEGYLVKKIDPLLNINYYFILKQEYITDQYGLTRPILTSEVKWYKVHPESIMRYTGFDINNDKVYEGDIIKVFPSNRLMYVIWNEETLSWELVDVGTKINEINHLINCISLGELNIEAVTENEFKSKIIGNIYYNNIFENKT